MFTLDTCALIHLTKATPEGAAIKQALQAESLEPVLFISIVTKAELLSFVIQNKWGKAKWDRLTELLDETIIIPIQTDDILKQYAELDAYSKSRLPSKQMPAGQTARTMGKNDIWIASTAVITGSTLVTTDSDFDHLNGVYLPVLKTS